MVRNLELIKQPQEYHPYSVGKNLFRVSKTVPTTAFMEVLRLLCVNFKEVLVYRMELIKKWQT